MKNLTHPNRLFLQLLLLLLVLLLLVLLLLVLVQLRRFCHAKGGELMFPRAGGEPGRGPIDPLAMARVAGRREVFDYLLHLLSMNLEARQNLIEDSDE